MDLSTQQCPNCAGRLETTTDNRKKMCPFCGAEFLVDGYEDTVEERDVNVSWEIENEICESDNCIDISTEDIIGKYIERISKDHSSTAYLVKNFGQGDEKNRKKECLETVKVVVQ